MSFNITKKIGEFIYFDENNKKWTVPEGMFRKKINQSKIYSYNDIVDFELLEDGNSVEKGGVGRAIVGGTLFGGVGAIVGGVTGHKHKSTCSRLQIKITLNNFDNPVEYINFIWAETRKDKPVYKNSFNSAQEVMSILQLICNNSSNMNESKNSEQSSTSNFDEIRKYKNLLDIGAITQEEFDLKKKELLNL